LIVAECRNCRQAAAVNMHGGAGLGRGQV